MSCHVFTLTPARLPQMMSQSVQCNTLQHTATRCNTLQHTATDDVAECPVCHSVLRPECVMVAVCCSVLPQCVAVYTCKLPQHTDVCNRLCCRESSVLQCVAVCCSVLLQCIEVC